MKRQIGLIGIALFAAVVLAPAASATLNCAGSTELLCGDTSAQGTINDSGSNGVSVYCGFFAGYAGKEDVYSFTLAGQTEVTLVLTPTGGVNADLFLVADCDESICYGASINTGTTPDNIFVCLGPGSYRVVVDAYATSPVPYTIQLRGCNTCLPVPAISASWGGIKALPFAGE